MSVRFNILVGCESGIVKGIDTINRGIYSAYTTAETYADGIIHLEWSSTTTTECDYMQALIATKKNNILQWNFRDESTQQIGQLKRTSPLKGLAQIGDDSFITCSEDGAISIDRCNNECLISEIETNAGPDICRMRINPFNRSFFGTGGKENDLKIWSIDEMIKTKNSQKKSVIFQAKNIRPNAVRLRMPVWVTDLQFIDERNRCLVVTGHHQIRLYDPQSSARRPVQETEFEQYPIMSLSLVHSANNERFLVGNSQGEMAEFDLKHWSNIVHKYTGSTGSIRSIDTHPTLPLIVSASIDQFLRVHNAETHRLVSKFFLKSRLTSVLFSPHEALNKEQTTNPIQTESDVTDEVWSQFKRKSADEQSSSRTEIKKRKVTVLKK